jgi:hypothetical protein
MITISIELYLSIRYDSTYIVVYKSVSYYTTSTSGNMQYIRIYQEKYPEDRLIIGGGAADYLHLKHLNGESVILKDVDVEVCTTSDGKEQLRRWRSILPERYLHTTDYEHIEIINWVDSTGEELSIDVFINQEEITRTVSIDGFLVKPLEDILSGYSISVEMEQEDIEYIMSLDPSQRSEEELLFLKDKHTRHLDRYQKLMKLV